MAQARLSCAVACCAAVDTVISAQPYAPSPRDAASLRLGVPSAYVFDGVDRANLATLGEVHKPSIADLFVATMKGTYA